MEKKQGYVPYFIAGTVTAFIAQTIAWYISGEFMSWITLAILSCSVAFTVGIIDEWIKQTKRAQAEMTPADGYVARHRCCKTHGCPPYDPPEK